MEWILVSMAVAGGLLLVFGVSRGSLGRGEDGRDWCGPPAGERGLLSLTRLWSLFRRR